ncbi:MAG: GNAT family N-acetyltransferase [Chloroflexi bacterium]|nr:GNAT family N-acetyltransferase [Chloroflexota bacterium]MCC6895272.1 GNAT family N-acetyltransferase [Anaerolineae bacterium]
MPNLRIVSYVAADHQRDVTRLVNEQIAPIPPYWKLTEKQVAEILAKDSLWEIHFEDEETPAWGWENEIVCVVNRLDNRVYAATRLDYRYDDGKLAMVSARWLVADPEHSTALLRLIDYITAKRETDGVSIYVHGRSDFSAGWGGVPLHAAHITRALAQKGFTPIQKWLVMTASISQWQTEPLSPLPAPYVPRWRIDDAHLSREVLIEDGDVLVGECQSWGIPPEFVACATYGQWMQIEWLGVEEPYQRRGFARRLLQEQFRYHALRGITHCVAHTELHNLPTQMLNRSLGFTVNAEIWSWQWSPS